MESQTEGKKKKEQPAQEELCLTWVKVKKKDAELGGMEGLYRGALANVCGMKWGPGSFLGIGSSLAVHRTREFSLPVWASHEEEY